MRFIELSNTDELAIVSPEDQGKLRNYTWYRDGQGYASTAVGPARDRKHLLMHRLVLNPPDGLLSDHINGNKVDNRRENLRSVTFQQNHWNSENVERKSAFIGVDFHRGQWRAQIRAEGKKLDLGVYDTAEAAALAYDQAATKYRGMYAKLNFPDLKRG